MDDSAQLALESFQKAIFYHQRGQLSEADRCYQLVLKTDDRHFPSVHGLGLIGLQECRHADAASLFRQAIEINGNSAEAHHHLAVALTELGRPEEAVEAFAKALAINPSFAEAHDSLGHALQMLGRAEEAIAHHEKALAIKPGYAAARNNLGNAVHRLGRSKEAIVHYQQALAINPAYDLARANLARALAALRFDASEPAAAARVGLDLKDANLLVTLGDVYFDTHEAELAYNAFHAAAAVNLHAAAFGLARAAFLLGKDVEAASLLKGLVERGIRRVDALTGLADLPTSVPGLDLVAQLEGASAEAISHEVKIKIGLALASALDKAGQHARAWQHLVKANRAMFAAIKAGLDDEAELQRSSLEELRANAGEAAHDSDGTSAEARAADVPISLLILGPSRSGKSTMEKLVATLGGVKRGYENSSVETALERTLQAAGLPRDGALKGVPSELYSNFRDNYIEELARRIGSAVVFTNTHPGAVHHATLLAAACPNVRLLLVKRNLEDNILRIYMKDYRQGYPHSYDIDAARRHVLWYQDMIDLLTEKFPAIARVVHYEDIIADPTSALRAAAELCGLPVPDGPAPVLGDDRGCAQPYRTLMAAALEGR
jgi:tetratricopeptide (TPR) repeat protein